MKHKAEEIFAGFRCGALECIGDTEKSIIKCDECGETGVLSIETALDIINNLYLDRELPEGLMEILDNIDVSDFDYQGMVGDTLPLEGFNEDE